MSSGAPAVRVRPPPRQRLRPRVRAPAYGHGTQHQKHGRFSRPRAKASVHVMFQTSVDNQPGKRHEPTAFPEVRHGHRIVVAPPHLVRPRQRHRTVAAVPDARISIDSVPGIWSRITAPAPSARAVRQQGFLPGIRNARRSTWAVAFRHRLRLHHHLSPARDHATGSGNHPAASGFEFLAAAAVEFREGAGAPRQVIRARIATREPTLAVLRRREEPPRLMIPANHRHRQRPATRTTVRDSVAGNGTERHGFWSPPPAQNSAPVIQYHHSPERRTGRFSRCVAHLLWAAARSLVMNGICPSKASACVPLNWVNHCT